MRAFLWPLFNAMKVVLRLVMCFALFLVLPAQAQLRTIPANALRAEMQLVSPRTLTLDGHSYALSVGAMIYNTSNMLVLTQAIDTGSTYPVRVLINDQKEVYRVWFLTSAEAAEDAPKLTKSRWWWPF